MRINLSHMLYTACSEIIILGAAAMINAEWLAENAQWVVLCGSVAFIVVAIAGHFFSQDNENNNKESGNEGVKQSIAAGRDNFGHQISAETVMLTLPEKPFGLVEKLPYQDHPSLGVELNDVDGLMIDGGHFTEVDTAIKGKNIKNTTFKNITVIGTRKQP